MERFLEVTKADEQPLTNDSRRQAYAVIDVLLIIGIISKMVSLAILMVEALNKWFRESHKQKWITIATMLFALLMVSLRSLMLPGCFNCDF
jgi:hypothetical protein